MIRRAVAPFCVVFLAAASALAQAPTPNPGASVGQPPPPTVPQSLRAQPAASPPDRVFCEQDVSFQVADPATIPDSYRRFVGIWSDAAWDAHTCAALIVQDVKADGTASIVYIFGPQGPTTPGPGGVLHGTGVIRGDELRFQNSDGSQFAFLPGIVDMTGHLINPKGESFEATFKQTP
jgi:hypothetical protein